MNEEDNCDFYNRQRCRALAKEAQVPVIAFDALHDGNSQADGLAKNDDLFAALPKRFECCVAAPVILMHNFAVEHGLINSSKGVARDLPYAKGCGPNQSRRPITQDAYVNHS